MEDLEREGKLKWVQGYAQCECGADLEDERVVKRIWKVEKGYMDGVMVMDERKL